MPRPVPNKRIGVLSQRFSDEENPDTAASDELLARFLATVDFNTTPHLRTWECNPLYRELKRTLQGTIHLEKVEELLMEKYKDINTWTSAQSTLTTLSSAQSANTQDQEQSTCSSAMDSDDRLWWLRQAEQRRASRLSLETPSNGPVRMRASNLEPEITPEDETHKLERTGTGSRLKEGLEGLEGTWKLKWDEPVRLLDLCKLMDLDKRDIERREHHVLLEITVMEQLLCVKSEIFGLYKLEIPLNGEISRIPRLDQQNGIMTAHIETKRMGLRMIYTWDHPAAATRRDNYEVSADGHKLTLTAYLQKRDGQYCKVKWQFEKRADNVIA